MFVQLTIVAMLSTPGLSSASEPSAVVKQGNVKVQEVLNSPEPSVEKLASRVDNFVDFAELAKRAMGKEWNRLNKKQQDEFASTMKGLLRASYAQKAMGQGSAEIRYGEESVKGNEAEVPSTIVVKRDEFPVVYKLFRKGTKAPWKIYDVVTDQVSLVATYRDQFRKLIAAKGYDGLLTTLKEKKEQLEKKSTASANGGSSDSN